MKIRILIPLLVVSAVSTKLTAADRPDSLLTALDRAIAARDIYTHQKDEKIQNLKQQKKRFSSPDETYQINERIINEYESFICDSAEFYIHENLDLARQLGNSEYITDSELRLAFVYSLSGLFVQASDVLRKIDYDRLNWMQKIRYCWNSIRYYENLAKYTAEPRFSAVYEKEIALLRGTLLDILPAGSEEWLKEEAFRLQAEGDYQGALEILNDIFRRNEPGTHGYAMAAMSLSKVYRQTGDRELENEFLKLAAITDITFAVKENEALLSLALNLFESGDIDRSFNYIGVALKDANFYNSRFKNTVIARVQPVIESNYLNKIEKQKRNLRVYATLISIFLVALIIALSIIFTQMKIVVRARKNLRKMNHQLVGLNRGLGEANIVKEKYIGYFMSQCAAYVNKLDEYRKDVNHKVKNGQFDRIYKPSTKELEKEIEELYANFDEAFLKLFPDFVDGFNSLLEPDAKYELEGNRLNTELRIFALMRLGITNINQIAEFLRCSLQTIYNYRSKVRSKARKDISNFEEEVRKLGLSISQSDSI